MADVIDSLESVNFYTPLDPYYYTVDNRPLLELDRNITLVAGAADASIGEGKRAALGSAAVAQAITGVGENGTGAAVGSYDLTIGGLTLDILHGFGTFMVAGTDTINTYQKPQLAVHDRITRLSSFVQGNDTYSSVYVVQMSWREPLDTDKVGTTSSDTKVAEITAVRTGDINIDDPIVEYIPAPGYIVLMYVVIPSGTNILTEDNIVLKNFRTIGQTSSLEKYAEVDYQMYTISGSNGQQTLDLSASNIDINRSKSIEVFVDGVNQFDWVANSINSSIQLNSPLTSAATIKVRQANLSLI
mgnify:CR=1 FL=1